MKEHEIARITEDLQDILSNASNGNHPDDPQRFAPPVVRSPSPDAPKIHAAAMETAFMQAAYAVEETIEGLQIRHNDLIADLRAQAKWLRDQGAVLASVVHDHVAMATSIHQRYRETHDPARENGAAIQ